MIPNELEADAMRARPVNCDAPKSRLNIGKNTNIRVSRFFHCVNHFSVFGSRYRTKASGAIMMRSAMTAWRVATVINPVATAISPLTNNGTSIQKDAPVALMTKPAIVPPLTTAVRTLEIDILALARSTPDVINDS